MIDFVERLRALSVTVEDAREAADEIERLRTELVEATMKTCDMGERVGKAEADSDMLRVELAAVHAREELLRAWIEAMPVVLVRDDEIVAAKGRKREILLLPSDHTALNERLKAERERIAAMLGGFPITNDTLIRIREAIRNLGGEA